MGIGAMTVVMLGLPLLDETVDGIEGFDRRAVPLVADVRAPDEVARLEHHQLLAGLVVGPAKSTIWSRSSSPWGASTSS
jgi:hypothetical protein